MLTVEECQEYLSALDQLLRFKSVTPDDAGAQQWLTHWVQQLGLPYAIQKMTVSDTENIAITLGHECDTPHIHFIGHTDVVPAVESRWSVPAFALTLKDGLLYGRGVCDMKGAIIAFIAAFRRRFHKNPKACATMLLTSDEEGAGTHGLQHLLKDYPQNRALVAVIGEPTAEEKVGDRIKNGRRGSLHGTVVLKGQSAHVAYPHKKDPISHLSALLTLWEKTDWDEGRGTEFSHTSFQITKIQTQDCVENVIPGMLTIRFNFRYIAATSRESLQKLFNRLLESYPFDYEVDWRFGATPWSSALSLEQIEELFGQTIKTVCHRPTQLCCSGGVSDGYKVAQHLTPYIIEIGLPHKTAHQNDEHIQETDFYELIYLYEALLEKIGC